MARTAGTIIVTVWLLLIFKVPSDPTARCVYIWGKLKRLGAILLHDSAWVLPAPRYTKEQLQWLVAEIIGVESDALLWEAQAGAPEQGLRIPVSHRGSLNLSDHVTPDAAPSGSSQSLVGIFLDAL
jgi:hypothetical protein